MTTTDVYFPTGPELVNMILRMCVTEFEKYDQAKLTIPTLLQQADRAVNEKALFTYEDTRRG